LFVYCHLFLFLADTTSLSISMFLIATVEALTTLSSLPKDMPSSSKLEEIRESEKETNDLLPELVGTEDRL
jgi:hypothetical protein